LRPIFLKNSRFLWYSSVILSFADMRISFEVKYPEVYFFTKRVAV
jgi:hypothetical protein